MKNKTNLLLLLLSGLLFISGCQSGGRTTEESSNARAGRGENRAQQTNRPANQASNGVANLSQKPSKTLPANTPKEIVDYFASLRNLEKKGRDLLPMWEDRTSPKPKFVEAADLSDKYKAEAALLKPISEKLARDYTIFEFYRPLVKVEGCVRIQATGNSKDCDEAEAAISELEDKIISNKTASGEFSAIKR